MFGLTVTVAASGHEFQSSHTVHMMNVKRGRIYRAVLLSHTVSSKCSVEKLRIYLAKLLSWHFITDRKQWCSAELLPRRGSTLHRPKHSSQVAQYVQSVKKSTGTLIPNLECSPGGTSVTWKKYGGANVH